MTNEPNIKGCIKRALEALEDLCDEYPSYDSTFADLNAFVAALPEEKQRSEVKDDFEYVTEQHNFLCDTAELLQEAISDE